MKRALAFFAGGIPHSLEFHWKLDDGTKWGSNNHCTYSPSKGLVRVSNNSPRKSVTDGPEL